MNLISCVSSDWGIGKNNKLLFHIKEDMKQFKSLTTGKIVIMGRKTFESLPNKPLENRLNIVISSNLDYCCSIKKKYNVICVNSVSSLLSVLPDFDSTSGFSNTFVIGGESIYHEMLPLCDTAYITKVDCDKECDRFFPNLDNNVMWKLVDTFKNECNYENIRVNFLVYRRVKDEDK